MTVKKLLFVCGIIASQFASGQNARYSQLFSAPLQYNPALCGRFDGQIRGGMQFSYMKSNVADVSHYSVFIDAKLGKYRSMGDEKLIDTSRMSDLKVKIREAKDETNARKSKGYWAVGGYYYHFGQKNDPINADFISGTVARHFYLSRNQYFGVGAQMAYATASLDETRGFAFDPEISDGSFSYDRKYAAPRISRKSYVDFNAGAYYGMSTDQVAFEIGGAMYHFFYPQNDILALDNETRLRHRVTAHSVLRLKFNSKWGLVQRNMYWGEGLYYRSTVFNGDSAHREALWMGVEMYKTNPTSKYNLNFGLYTRSFRTVMPYLNASLGSVANVRCSYEFPLSASRFTAYTAKRAEIALILTYKRSTPTGVRFYKKFNYW